MALLYADEDFDAAVVAHLRRLAHNILTVQKRVGEAAAMLKFSPTPLRLAGQC